MCDKLNSVPSLKYKRKKRPSRTLSQQAPLANHDEFQFSDVSDSEDHSPMNNCVASGPNPKLQHFHSSDEVNSKRTISSKVITDFSKEKNQIFNESLESNIEEVTEEIVEEINRPDENVVENTEVNTEVNTEGTGENTSSHDVISEEDDENIQTENDENIQTESDENIQNESDENIQNENDENIQNENDENEKCELDREIMEREDYIHDEQCSVISEEESDAQNDETRDNEESNEEFSENASKCGTDIMVEDYEEIENNETKIEINEIQDISCSEDQNCDLDIVIVSEYSGIATEPNTPNDVSMDESSQKIEDQGMEDAPGRYQREEYYDYVEDPVLDAGDDPFSLEYHHPKVSHYQPYSDNHEPPQIVITEPSDQDLPSLDDSKLTKPSRPPERPKHEKIPEKIPKRPPPPSAPINKNTEVELKTIPPPPSSKRRERKTEIDPVPDKQTKFPFKTHFEKKPSVPNPKKAILNVLKGESKKERKRRKAEEEFERILNTVDPEEAPLCDSTDEWKAYKEFQDRISASVQKSQDKIKSILEEEKSNISQDWDNFEDKNKENQNSKVLDLGSSNMSELNSDIVDELDIWGCDNTELDNKSPLNFEDDEVKFVKTFNQRIEDASDEAFETSNLKTDELNDNLFTEFDSSFLDSNDVPEPEVSDNHLETDEPKSIRKERPKPVRQETLSGNNPFRKASMNSEEEEIHVSTQKTEEDESPFIAVLKSIGISNLEETGPGFDPLTTIYPDSEEEKPSSNEDDLSSQSSNDTFQPFKITTKIKMIDPTETTDEPVKILPSPNISSSRGPRERKLPPEMKPFSKAEKEKEVDNLFADIRTDDTKDLLEINNEPSVITFDSPLSGKFSGEKIEWEAFPVSQPNTVEEETVWGEDLYFKPEFEPLPGEIVTFEPYHSRNENMEWKLLIRQPEKKSKAKQISRYTSNRWWKESYLRLATEKDRPCLKFFDNLEDSEPYRLIRLEPYMQLSRDKLQQYDKYGKLQIFKINHVVYKEMVGMRTEKFSFKTLQNLVSHKPKMNMVFDHMPLRTEIVKIGSLDQKPLRSLMTAIEDAMLSIKSHRDATLEYTKEEVCCYVNDEYECTLNDQGSILDQKARTRILFAAFVIGNPHIVLGINDKWRFGNEIVRRQDIIPIMHDDWINIYEPEFHSCIDMVEYEKDHMIKFYPLDGCKFELMRFRVPLRPNKELPLKPEVRIKINGVKIDIRVDLSVPGFFSASKRHGAVHCDDIEIRVPIPEEWAYHFRIEKHTKYGSMHSALRKPGKIKGFERITQIAQSFLPPSMLEASSGVAKYEHLYRSIVWRIPRLPDKNEASYKPHMMTCKFILAPHDTVPPPEEMIKVFNVEFTMPASTISGATVRSISVEHTTTPERFVKYLATFKYTRDITYEWGDLKPAPIVSILDQTAESVEETHSSDESHQEKSSPSETTNSPRKSPKNDSVDLIECASEQNVEIAQNHSAYDDLLTLNCFSKNSSSDFSQSTTGLVLSGNLMDDIAMVDE